MEKFKKLLEKKNIDDISNYLKHSDVNKLRTIAKRYKIPSSTKKKELIISSILQAIQSDTTFHSTPPIHQMTIAQLRTKAKELNIDFSTIHSKQALRLSIIDKEKRYQTSADMENANETLTNDFLKNKSLPYLKALAKKYGIKVSKLSANQLIALILDKQVVGEPPKTLVIDRENLSKMKKNELLALAEEMNLNVRGKDKKTLLEILKSRLENGSSTSEIEATSNEKSKHTSSLEDKSSLVIENIPISKEMEKVIVNDRKFTIKVIKDNLKKFNINVPAKFTKRNELIHLFTLKPTSSVSVENTDKLPKTKESTTRRQGAEVIQQSIVRSPKTRQEKTSTTNRRRKSTADSDVISLDDIHSPFNPVPLMDLIEEPTDQQLQEELYRCLQFYEEPK